MRSWMHGGKLACLAVSLLVWGTAVGGRERPASVPSDRDGVTLLRELRVTKSREVARLFQPVGEGVGPAAIHRALDGRKFVFLPVSFAEGKAPRMTWDAEVRADWSRASSIVLDLTSGGLEDLSHLTFFAHSVNGWYVATFALDLYGDWTHVELPRETFIREGKPESWKRIDRIRLSLWRRTNTVNGWLGLANVGIRKERRHGPKIAVIRGDACNEHYGSSSASFASYAESVLATLKQSGIGAQMVSDREVTHELLKRFPLVVLPHNTWMPQEMISALRQFVSQGGKLIGFFAMPEEINELLGIRFASRRSAKPPEGVFGGFLASSKALPGQPAFALQNSYFTYVPADDCGRVLATWAYADGRDSRIPALVLLEKGAYVSHVWLEGAQADRRRLLELVVNELLPLDQVRLLRRKLRSLGRQDVTGDWEGLVDLVRKSGRAEAWNSLRKALSLHDRAAALLEQDNWQEAGPVVERALEESKKAFFLTRRSRGGERRLVWCHAASGVAGKTWEESVKILADCGFTDVLANLCWSGCAYYDSKVLPRYGGYGRGGDRLRQCLDACTRYGVGCHVWKVCFNMGSHASKAYSEAMVKAGRVQVSRNGRTSSRILCPTHPQNQRDEIETMVELVRRYPRISGVHFDYIRFSDGDACFCPGCRRRFESYLGRRLSAWPFDWSDAALRKSWYDFRREAISHVVETVHERVKAFQPSVEISAAVYAEWDRDRDGVGQDVELWCRKRWVDFVCPMNYRDHDLKYRSMVRYQMKRSHGVAVYPGIGLTCWQEPNNAYRLVRQIELGRELGAKGFAVFDFCQGAMEPLKWLKYGCTRRR